MTVEAVQEYKKDTVMTQVAKDERKLLYRGEKQLLNDKIKRKYGRGTSV